METEDWVEVGVDSIRVHVQTGQHVVILKEKNADRYLPIWIGPFEANAIALKITGQTPERPITHDLMLTAMSEFDMVVKRIVVTSLSGEVFFARLHVEQNGRETDIDSRPSDAIALAVRFECPIYVTRDVLERAGVIPEKEEDEQSAASGPIDEDRLAVFRDLVNSLDLPDLPDEPGSRGGTSKS
ncbi:MAG: bifunctional nuclease family protein [Chloroflexi bacterium]|nr:MAG: bifunctional nuclease family protein [Chloroflexota bacterium]